MVHAIEASQRVSVGLCRVVRKIIRPSDWFGHLFCVCLKMNPCRKNGSLKEDKRIYGSVFL